MLEVADSYIKLNLKLIRRMRSVSQETSRMQKIGTLLFSACLGTVLLTGTAKADSVFNSLQLGRSSAVSR
jgi:hypothetical protein